MLVSRKYDSAMMAALLAALKSHLRITADDLDGQLDMYLRAAVSSAEQFVGMYLVSSRIVDKSDFAAQWGPQMPPLRSVEEVTVDGEVVDPSLYEVSADGIRFGGSVSGGTVSVTCRVGRNHIEEDIRAAILLRAAKLFNNPADSAETLINASDNLLAPYRHVCDGEPDQHRGA